MAPLELQNGFMSALVASTKIRKVWRCHPDVVSKGAQKNFAHFAEAVGKEWTAQSDQFNEAFYRHSVAKAIAFRALEKLVTEQPWYEGGYRANTVAYAIAKLSHDMGARGLAVDFEAIWKRQKISEALAQALLVAADEVHKVLISPSSGVSNVTEWAKQQACWARVSNLQIKWPAQWLDEVIGKAEVRSQKQAAVKDQRMVNGIEAQMLVVNAGGPLWQEVVGWAASRKLLSEDERGILHAAATTRPKPATEKQAIRAMEILRRLHTEGCQLGRELIQ
jgi:hypothetical protein